MEKYILDNPKEACKKVIEILSEKKSPLRNISVALSGGNTPKLMFSLLRNEFPFVADNGINYFWGDERMVTSESVESNYGEFARELLFTGVVLKENVFHAAYNEDYVSARYQYEGQINGNVKISNKFPRFDVIILGVGEDGHIASIFPDNLASFYTDEIVQIVKQPTTEQVRITLSGTTINNAKNIILLATGNNKKNIIKRILIDKDETLPATHIKPIDGNVFWCIDKDAAELIK